MKDNNPQSNNDLLKEIKKELQTVKKFVSIVVIIFSLMVITLMLAILIKNNKPVKVTTTYYRIENKDGITDTIFEGTAVTTPLEDNDTLLEDNK
ncbi:MAG: hypothetical protein LBE13_23065 [Bacteroidales bacterium]|jgi:Na+-transporting NADH:ubiquinone oxidoreductase subunit NqrF|nr:hypothetical protein [Bacteroidales bacterium]